MGAELRPCQRVLLSLSSVFNRKVQLLHYTAPSSSQLEHNSYNLIGQIEASVSLSNCYYEMPSQVLVLMYSSSLLAEH